MLAAGVRPAYQGCRLERHHKSMLSSRTADNALGPVLGQTIGYRCPFVLRYNLHVGLSLPRILLSGDVMKDCVIQTSRKAFLSCLRSPRVRSRWNMLIRRVHRNKEGHYTRACLRHYKCSCAGFADGLLCSFIPAGILLPTLPPPGVLGKRKKGAVFDLEL